MNEYECPCRNCTTETGRSQTCHSECDKYLKWKDNHDINRENERKRREQETIRYPYKGKRRY